MSSVINLTLLERVDQARIDAGNVQFTVVNGYSTNLDRTIVRDIDTMDAPTLAAFKKVTDFITYGFEAGCAIINVALDVSTGVFDFGASYLRDKIATDSVTPIANGLLLGIRFEFAGFTTNTFIDTVFEWGKGFTPEDIALLAAKIVTVTVPESGDGFTVASADDCRISFSKPVTVSGSYVINYPLQGTIL